MVASEQLPRAAETDGWAPREVGDWFGERSFATEDTETTETNSFLNEVAGNLFFLRVLS